MSLTARLAAAGLGAGILFAGAGSALAAPADDTASTDDSGSTEAAGAAPVATPDQGPGGPVYALEGVGVPLTDPALGVPKVLEVAVLPLGLLSDAAGEGGSTATPQGAQNGPGSTTA